MPTIPYTCPKTAERKEKSFVGGVTYLKKEHFEELVQRRKEAKEFEVTIEERVKHIEELSYKAYNLGRERDSALHGLKDVEGQLKKIQDEFNKLHMTAEEYRNASESYAVLLRQEHAKHEELVKLNARWTTDAAKIKANFEEDRRKALDREKQFDKDHKQYEATVLELWTSLESTKVTRLRRLSRRLVTSTGHLMTNIKPERSLLPNISSF